MFHVAAIFVNVTIKPAVGCYNLWADIRRSSCSPLEEKIIVKQDCLPTIVFCGMLLYPCPTKLEGGILDSPCPSVRPSVCRRHGFRSISQVCFGISISNFICMLMVAIGRSLLIFSDVTFKMAAWRPYWIFCFPDSNFTLALNINFKLQRHNTYVYG